jgi:molybdenum transport protein
MFYIPDSYLETLIEEDLPFLDLTTGALGIEQVPAVLDCVPKRDLVPAGVEEAARLFRLAGAQVELLQPEGARVAGGTAVLRARGRAGQLHAVYKQAQNIMEYASGIAGRCSRMLAQARKAAPDIELSVTRKHFPGTKRLSIKAALAGGASIHRLGLSDSILVFDQHRVFLDGASAFLELLPEMRRKFPEKKIAAEAASPAEALDYVKAGVDVIQCERFKPEELRSCVPAMRALNPRIKIAAAGGLNETNAAAYAASGVDILVTSWVYFGPPEDVAMRFAVDGN